MMKEDASDMPAGAARKVCIDPGHGGRDPGAVGGGLEEEDLALDVCRRVRRLLEAVKIEVLMTREDDTAVPKARRCQMANEAGADLFVSVHYNAASPGARGHEVIHAPGSDEGLRLARNISHAFENFFPDHPSRGIKTDMDTGRGPFTVLRRTAMPAVIVECGFITNATDRAMTDEPHERQRIAEAVAIGVSWHLWRIQDRTSPVNL